MTVRNDLAVLALVVLAPTISSCGHTINQTRSAAAQAYTRIHDTQPAGSPTIKTGYLHSDTDTDEDDGQPRRSKPDPTDVLFSTYGHKAHGHERRAIATLVKRYYAAASTGDAALACSLLAINLAEGLSSEPAPSTASCPKAIALVLAQQHAQLAADEVATMVVYDIRVNGDTGLAGVGFKTEPVGRVAVKREHGTWRMNALIDTSMS